MIAAHLRKERALTRCRYSVENCPPPPARERPVACYNFEKPRVRRVNRDAPPGAGAQLLKGLLEDKLRRTWAALAPAGPPPRLAQAAPAAVAVVLAARRAVDASAARRLRGAWTALRGSDLRPLALLLGACASRWRRNSIDGAWRALGRAASGGRAALGAEAAGRGSTPSRARARPLYPKSMPATAPPRVREGPSCRDREPGPDAGTAVTAAVANVARSQNRRRKLRALDQLRCAARATKVLLRVLRFRVVAEKAHGGAGPPPPRRGLSAAPRGGRRRAGRGESPMASAAQDAGRKAVGANRPAGGRTAAQRSGLRRHGRGGGAARGLARLAHHDRIHRHGVFRVQCSRRWRRRQRAAGRSCWRLSGAAPSKRPSTWRSERRRRSRGRGRGGRGPSGASARRGRAARGGRSRRPWPARTTRRPGSTARVIS